MQYPLKSVGFWDHILLGKENLKPLLIILKDKKLKNVNKFEYQEKYANKIIALIKKIIKCKDYIGYICLGHI